VFKRGGVQSSPFTCYHLAPVLMLMLMLLLMLPLPPLPPQLLKRQKSFEEAAATFECAQIARRADSVRLPT
jgi:hypothetical protein